MEHRKRIGEVFVKSGLLTNEQVEKALDIQKIVGEKLGAIVVKLGFLDEERLIKAFAEQENLPLVDLEKIVIPINLVKRFPRSIIEKYEIVPIAQNGETLTIVTSDPFSFDMVQEIQLIMNCKVDINLATRSSIIRTIDKIFAGKLEKWDSGNTRLSFQQKATFATGNRTSVTTKGEALIDILIEKNIITKEELLKKAKEIEKA